MDPDVIEVPPPIPHPSRLAKQKQVILHDVIDIDDDDDSDELMIIGEKFSQSNKGKMIEAIHGDHHVMEMPGFNFCQPDVGKFEPASKIESSHDLINVDGQFHDPSYNDDFVDLFSEVDPYAFLQAHFDNVDIPPGIEAPIPWVSGYNLLSKKSGDSSLYPWSHMQPGANNSHLSGSSQPSLSLEHTNPRTQGSSVGSSNLQFKFGNVDHSSGIGLTSPHLFSQSTHSTKKSTISQRRGRNLNLSLGVESSKSQAVSGSFQSIKQPSIFGSSTDHGFIDNSEAMMLPPAKKFIVSSSSYHPHFVGHDGSFHPSGIVSESPWLINSHIFKPSFTNQIANPNLYPPDPLHTPPMHMFGNAQIHNSASNGYNGTAVDSSIPTIPDAARYEILRKFQSFKQFDTVEDTSDHHFIRQNSSMKHHPKIWAKKIQEEWKILEKDLPDTIFVRVYESRMDLLRAVIIGAEGTPYHDGLFFFDVFFPSAYPKVPPQVHYHSGGLRLNPNLYHCGKVCLSLLNTWSGSKDEKWVPGVSTILQVLVSIQGLILNTKPYFNEPGYERTSGTKHGESSSLKYNEDTFILSLRTMVYMMRKPPKHFEDFVVGHFYNRARDILVACKAYMEGAQVGCLVKGGVQDVDEGDKTCSKQFKDSLTGYVNMIVTEFAKIGVKHLQLPISNTNTEQAIGWIA
ncbi:hypothetical protein Lal_00017841 [Lupinus albus]|uniref:E2 ubiquitin-conjugating enzyme n=1 Tax=Lupinus albus TaxID=3870 RepID=A0A6A4MW04_LUPAL|nr:putative aminoacyltransferase, E1 ubiquitin-activating enzyme [Lupinus albus]KAF1866458.1 hypothetical protein Lal_00017841 [Lupinus albus]